MFDTKYLIYAGIGIGAIMLLTRNNNSEFNADGTSSEGTKTVYVPTSYTNYDINTGTQTNTVNNDWNTNNLTTTAEGENISIEVVNPTQAQPDADPVISNGVTAVGGSTVTQPVQAPTVVQTTPAKTTTTTTAKATTNTNGPKAATVNTTSTGLNIRATPSTSAKILGSYNKGQKITVYEKTGNWYRVSYNGKTGYVSSSYVKII